MRQLHYLQEGFRLTQSALPLFFAVLATSLFSAVDRVLPHTAIEVLSFLSALAYTSLHLSLPYFLQQSESKTISLGMLVKVGWRNLKRAIVPLLFLGLLLVAVFVAIAAKIAMEKGDPTFYLQASLEETVALFDYQKPFSLVVFGLLSLLAFASVFFSLEQKGLLKSLVLSVGYSVKNLEFLVLIWLFSYISYFLASHIEANLQTSSGFFGYTIVSEYFSFLLTATIYRYYIKHKA